MKERDRGRDVGQHTQRPTDRRLVRLVTAGSQSALGGSQQRLDCLHLAAYYGGDRLGKAQPRPGADRLRRKRGQPTAECGAFAASQQRLHILFHQPGRPADVASGQSVPHGLVGGRPTAQAALA